MAITNECDILKMKDNNIASLEVQELEASKMELEDSPGNSPRDLVESSNGLNKENQVGSDSKQHKITRRKISDFILDKPFRIRSYLRRRPIPLKRCMELDVQCGTKSFHLQINRDIDEAVYCGASDLVDLFLGPTGLRLSDVNSILTASKYQARPRGKSNWEHDYNPAPDNDSDDEFFDTVKSKNKKEKEARAESAKRMAEVEFLKNPVERSKKFKSGKDGIFAKIAEIESVCGVVSLTVILNSEKDLCVYSGDPGLTTDFFTRGVRREDLPIAFNVRQFDCEEVEYNVCSVPSCVVSRNTLGKWRQAAMDLFMFPPSLPLSLHVCPDEERDRWMAEIDLDPMNKAKVVVCSLHFRDGYPNQDNPYPSELLGELKDSQVPMFRGRRPLESGVKSEQAACRMEAMHICEELVDSVLLGLDEKIDELERAKAEELRKWKEREEKRNREILLHKKVKYRQLNVGLSKKKSRPFKVKQLKKVSRFKLVKSDDGKPKYRKIRSTVRFKSKFDARLNCRFCSAGFSVTKSLFHHVRTSHVAPLRRRRKNQLVELEVGKEERERALSLLYPDNQTKLLDSKKKYVCAVCKSVCDLFGLFLHMKQVHHGLLCQYCLKLFKKVRDLDNHLSTSHGVGPRYYSSLPQLTSLSGTNFSLACADCNSVIGLEHMEQHDCQPGKTAQYNCVWCKAGFLGQQELEAHIVNLWCPKLQLGSAHSQRDTAVLYKILTGKTLDLPDEDPIMIPDMLDININSVLQVDIGKSVALKPAPPPVSRRKMMFSCADRNVLNKYGSGLTNLDQKRVALEMLPQTGTIFCGARARGINNHVKKNFKDLGASLDLMKEMSEQGDESNVHEIDPEIRGLNIEKAGNNFILTVPKILEEVQDDEATDAVECDEAPISEMATRVSRRLAGEMVECEEEESNLQVEETIARPRQETKGERLSRLNLEIEENLQELRKMVDREDSCLFCQQCKTVWVEATFLLSHLVVVHGGGEELTLAIDRIKRYQRESKGKEVIFRYTDTEDLFSVEFYQCSYCPSTESRSYSDLFYHTEAAHSTKVLRCNICHNVFLNYGSLISHVCSGPPTSSTARARFACKICHQMDLSSFLDFQTHIRSSHHICEICFQPQGDQRALYDHCTSHEQDLMCMKCFVTFERSESFKKHLTWKHGSESSPCSECYAPTWPHVYHFCLSDLPVVCQTCDISLANAAAYRVHQRKHTGVQPYACTCGRRFISKSLLWKHQVRRHPDSREEASKNLAAKKLKKDCEKFGAASVENLEVVQGFFDSWFTEILEGIRPKPDPTPSESSPRVPESSSPGPKESVLDAAIRSIMPDTEKAESTKKDSPIFQPPDRAAIQASIAGRTYTEDNSWQAGLDALLAGAGAPVPPAQLLATPEGKSSSEETKEPDKKAPVIGGLWNQDLMFIGNKNPSSGLKPRMPGSLSGGPRIRGPGAGLRVRAPVPVGVRPPFRPPGGLKTLQPSVTEGPPSPPSTLPGIRSLDSPETGSPAPLTQTQWDLDLSESSGDEIGPQAKRTPALKQRTVSAPRPLLDHDYCYAAFMSSQQPVAPTPAPQPDMSEMDKILSNVAFGGIVDGTNQGGLEKQPEKKKKKKKKKKKRRKDVPNSFRPKDSKSDSSTDSDSDIDVGDNRVDMFGIAARQKLVPGQAPASPTKRGRGRPKKGELPMKVAGKRGPKPKYHTPDVAKARGVMAGTARPSFDTDSSDHGHSDSDPTKVKVDTAPAEDLPSEPEVGSSDLDTDFSADEQSFSVATKPIKAIKTSQKSPIKSASKPTLKLKIKLPPQPDKTKKGTVGSPSQTGMKTPLARPKLKKRRRSSAVGQNQEEKDARPLSKKMRESLALNSRGARLPSSGSEEDPEDRLQGEQVETKAGLTGSVAGGAPRPGFNAENEKLYCYCQCPHDEVSEMIGCDAPDCRLEWFHFECVGIMVPPEGKWYCPECTKRYGL